MYPGYLNSSYVPDPIELGFIEHAEGQLGPLLLSGLVPFCLQGVIYAQITNYIHLFPFDPIRTKVFVWAMGTLSTAKLIHTAFTLWSIFVINYGDWSIFSTSRDIQIHTTLPVLTTVFITCLVQVFFIDRCFRLSKKNWLFLIVSGISMALSLAAGIVFTYLSLKSGPSPPPPAAPGGGVPDFGAGGEPQPDETFGIWFLVTLTSSLVCDVVITATTCFYLHQARSGFARGDSLAAKLIQISIQSALFPTICGILNLAFWKRIPTQIVTLWNALLPHLYVSAALYTLNCRTVLRSEQRDTFSLTGISGRFRGWSGRGWSKGDSESGQNQVRLHPLDKVVVSKETHVEVTTPKVTSWGTGNHSVYPYD